MKAKHHFYSSIAVGGVLYFTTHSIASLIGTFVGGFLIDADHVLDQAWSIYLGAPYTRRQSALQSEGRGWRAWIARYFRRRKLVRMPLIFHSYEILLLLSFLTLAYPTLFLIGLLSGYALHMALDLYRHHNEFRSTFFYSLFYRLAKGFRRESLVKADNL